MNLNVPNMTTYPTDPASYLQRLTNGASTGSTQDVLGANEDETQG